VCWPRSYVVSPAWPSAPSAPGGGVVLAEGHTPPLAWDGPDAGLGPGIDATVAAAFELHAVGGQPTAASALAAKIPPRHQGKRLAAVMLKAMAGRARRARRDPPIAPVRRGA